MVTGSPIGRKEMLSRFGSKPSCSKASMAYIHVLPTMLCTPKRLPRNSSARFICGLEMSFQLTRLDIDVSIFTSTPCAAAPSTETPEVNAAWISPVKRLATSVAPPRITMSWASMPCLAKIPCSCAAHKLSALLLTDAAPMLTRTGALAARAGTENKLRLKRKQQRALIIQDVRHDD